MMTSELSETELGNAMVDAIDNIIDNAMRPMFIKGTKFVVLAYRTDVEGDESPDGLQNASVALVYDGALSSAVEIIKHHTNLDLIHAAPGSKQ